MVAREGFEPSKPLGRQIYSLLRLTASLPRRYHLADTSNRPVVVTNAAGASCSRDTGRGRLQAPSTLCQDLSACDLMPSALSFSRLFFVRVGSAGIVELAKGFEPPTG